MRLFFDNCTSPVLADTLGGYVRHLGHTAHHIATLPCGRSAPDLVWIDMLSREAGWIVFTADKRISRNKAERAAYRQAGLLGFALAPGFQKMPIHRVAATLVSRWPDMEQLMGLVATVGLYEVPVGNGGFRPLPL